MKVHTDRSILDELQELYDMAVQEHGRLSLSSQIIGESLEAERRRLGQAPSAMPVHAALRPARAAQGQPLQA